MMDFYVVDPTTCDPPKTVASINFPDLYQETITAFGVEYVWAVNKFDFTKVRFALLPGSSATQSSCYDLVDAHTGGLGITEKIAIQHAEILTAVVADLDSLRDETADNAITIGIVRKFRDLQGDTDTIDTAAQALTYWNTKQRLAVENIKLYCDTGTTSYRAEAADIRTNMDRGLLHGIKLAVKFLKD